MPAQAPPSGDPWDAPLLRCPFALFDLEMTGPDPEHDAIIEVAITRVVNGVIVGALDTFVYTDLPSTPAALALHGIATHAHAEAPSFADLAPAVVQLLDGAVPVAHGITLDLPFINRALASVGRPERVDFALDTVTLARRALHARSYALGRLATQLHLGPHRWHRAGEDVRALRALFAVLVDSLAPQTARDLWEVRVAQRGAGTPMIRSQVARTITALSECATPATLVVRTPGREPVSLHGVVRGTERHAFITLDDGSSRVVRLDRILRIDPWM